MVSGRIPHRTIRIEDDLWHRFDEAVDWFGEGSKSSVINRKIRDYVRRYERERAKQGEARGAGDS